MGITFITGSSLCVVPTMLFSRVLLFVGLFAISSCLPAMDMEETPIQNNVPVADPLIEMMHEHAISADGSQAVLQDAHNQAAHHLIQEEQVAHHQAAHNEAQRGKQNQDVQQESECAATDTTNPPTDPPTYPPTLNHMKLLHRRRRRAATKEPSTTPSKPLTLETKPPHSASGCMSPAHALMAVLTASVALL